jgi:AcrR family transcriptional regulator
MPPGLPQARSRILAAASQLFETNGVRATGVDALIETADVAKATFYRHFASKDDLIVAWLQDPHTRWFDRMRAEVALRTSSPEEVVPALFVAIGDWLEAGDYRGCPYLNTAVEFPDATHRALPVARTYLREIERFLQQTLAAAGYQRPAELGTQLQTMLAGSIALGVAHQTGAFIAAAGDAAAKLLEASPRGRMDPAPVVGGPG